MRFWGFTWMLSLRYWLSIHHPGLLTFSSMQSRVRRKKKRKKKQLNWVTFWGWLLVQWVWRLPAIFEIWSRLSVRAPKLSKFSILPRKRRCHALLTCCLVAYSLTKLPTTSLTGFLPDLYFYWYLWPVIPIVFRVRSSVVFPITGVA